MTEIHLKISSILSQIITNDKDPIKKEEFLKSCKSTLLDLIEEIGTFTKNKSVGTVIDELPDIGQILGRLIVSQTVRGCPVLYTKTIQCIHRLWKKNPKDTLEERSSHWGSTQVKNSVCPPVSSYFDVCQLGIPIDKVTKEVIIQKKLQIEEELKRRYKEKLNSQLKDQLMCLQSDKWFMSIVSQLQRLPINSIMLSLWEHVISVCSLYPSDDQVAGNICLSLQKSLQQRKDLRPDVTIKTCLKLWMCSNQALEQEVLFRLELCSKHVLLSNISSVWKDSKLIPVCINDAILYKVVCRMLITVLENDLDILTSFLMTIWNEKRKYKHQDTFILSDMYSANYKPLVELLSVYPNDIKQENLGVHVKAVSELFKTTVARHGKTTDLLLLCLQFKVWYQMALQFCFTCDRHFTSGCLDLISCYSRVWYTQQHQAVKDVMTRIVLCLRPLLVKSSLCFTDLMCVLSTNQNTYQGHIEVTVKHLLLMFTFQATGGLNVLSDVLRFVSSSDRENDHMTVLLESHDQLQISGTDWPVYKSRQYQNVLLSLLDKCDEGLHTEIKEAVNCFIESLKFRQ